MRYYPNRPPQVGDGVDGDGGPCRYLARLSLVEGSPGIFYAVEEVSSPGELLLFVNTIDSLRGSRRGVCIFPKDNRPPLPHSTSNAAGFMGWYGLVLLRPNEECLVHTSAGRATVIACREGSTLESYDCRPHQIRALQDELNGAARLAH
jgi:hypothetical protein